MESEPDSSILIEHDLFRKPVSTPGSGPGAGILGIVLSQSPVMIENRAAEIKKSNAGYRERR
jgi:hypothetical protein